MAERSEDKSAKLRVKISQILIFSAKIREIVLDNLVVISPAVVNVS